MRCDGCGNWVRERKTLYGDGTEIVTYTAPEGKGRCRVLALDTDPTFGCTSFQEGGHVDITPKTGFPHHHFVMIHCPACSGNPGGGGCKCAGTGLVRLYDDGYVGDERTRRHPKDAENPPAIDPGTLLAPVAPASVL